VDVIIYGHSHEPRSRLIRGSLVFNPGRARNSFGLITIDEEIRAEIILFFMVSTDLEKRIKTLAQWMFEAKHLVVFTGAGISTESGLPDFRGPDGIWTRQAKGLPQKMRDFSSAEPNAGHMAIVELQKLGKLDFLISQNVDNLHLKSGIRPDLLAELHGNVTKLRCTRCEAQVDKSAGLEVCSCGGRLVSSVVNFGQPLPQKELADSYRHSQRCDLFIVVGSSLVVTPAADMPKVAVKSGARLVIINQGKTPLDRVAHLRFEERIGEVLPPAVAQLAETVK
jgi:NAD-dependent SIR2 family protein deacetylase